MKVRDHKTLAGATLFDHLPNSLSIEKIIAFATVTLSTEDFEQWVYQSETLEGVLGVDFYDDVISLSFNDQHAVSNLKSDLFEWLGQYFKLEFDRPKQLAYISIYWLALSLLLGNFSISEGARKITEYYNDLYSANEEWDLFSVFVAFDSETDHLPRLRQKLYWSKHAYEAKIQEMREYEMRYRESILKSCRLIVDKYRLTSFL